MGSYGVDAEQAFQILTEQSQRENVKLHRIADRLVTRTIETGT